MREVINTLKEYAWDLAHCKFIRCSVLKVPVAGALLQVVPVAKTIIHEDSVHCKCNGDSCLAGEI